MLKKKNIEIGIFEMAQTPLIFYVKICRSLGQFYIFLTLPCPVSEVSYFVTELCIRKC